MPYSGPDARRLAKRDSARRRRARLLAAGQPGATSDVLAAVTFRYPARDGGGREEWQLAGVNLGPRGTGPPGLTRLLSELSNAIIREHNVRPLT